jgi:hypothetical protein
LVWQAFREAPFEELVVVLCERRLGIPPRRHFPQRSGQRASGASIKHAASIIGLEMICIKDLATFPETRSRIHLTKIKMGRRYPGEPTESSTSLAGCRSSRRSIDGSRES